MFVHCTIVHMEITEPSQAQEYGTFFFDPCGRFDGFDGVTARFIPDFRNPECADHVGPPPIVRLLERTSLHNNENLITSVSLLPT